MPDAVKANATSLRSDTPDKAEAVLTYGDGTAILKSSRVAERSIRRMTIIYPSGEVKIDFNAKTLVHTTPFALNADFAGDPSAKDSLGEATDIFVRAILDKTPVLVTAEEGAIAVLTALQIDGALKRS